MSDEEAKETPALGLGDRMRAARDERGMTTKDLGEELRMQRALVSMIESGEEIPDKDAKRRIDAWLSSSKPPKHRAPRTTYEEGGAVRQKRSTIG